MADADYTPEPDWMDGYTGTQEAYEDHLDASAQRESDKPPVTILYSQMRPIVERHSEINFDYDVPSFIVRSYAEELRIFADELEELVSRSEQEAGATETNPSGGEPA